MYSIKWTKIINNNNNKFLEYLCIGLSINKKKADKTFEYPLFDTLSKGSAPPSTMNNVYFPELEKLARKLNKAFEKKGTKYLLKKQKELNDNTIQISIALLNGTIHLTYTKPIVEEK